MVATASPAPTQRRRHTTPLTLTLPGPSGALRPTAVTPLMEARLKRLRRNHASHIPGAFSHVAQSKRSRNYFGIKRAARRRNVNDLRWRIELKGAGAGAGARRNPTLLTSNASEPRALRPNSQSPSVG